jgi:hypothetical protein
MEGEKRVEKWRGKKRVEAWMGEKESRRMEG